MTHVTRVLIRVLGGADIGGAGDAAGGKTWPSAAPAAAKSGQRLT